MFFLFVYNFLSEPSRAVPGKLISTKVFPRSKHPVDAVNKVVCEVDDVRSVVNQLSGVQQINGCVLFLLFACIIKEQPQSHCNGLCVLLA